MNGLVTGRLLVGGLAWAPLKSGPARWAASLLRAAEIIYVLISVKTYKLQCNMYSIAY